MTWDDTGFLISKNKYSENSLIVEFFTENHGKVPGIIFGGTSKKIKLDTLKLKYVKSYLHFILTTKKNFLVLFLL